MFGKPTLYWPNVWFWPINWLLKYQTFDFDVLAFFLYRSAPNRITWHGNSSALVPLPCSSLAWTLMIVAYRGNEKYSDDFVTSHRQLRSDITISLTYYLCWQFYTRTLKSSHPPQSFARLVDRLASLLSERNETNTLDEPRERRARLGECWQQSNLWLHGDCMGCACEPEPGYIYTAQTIVGVGSIR